MIENEKNAVTLEKAAQIIKIDKSNAEFFIKNKFLQINFSVFKRIQMIRPHWCKHL